ncbi:MAG: hypothetical protein NWQ31_08285 [Polaribacter sp.]|nr:hypothetical protein [Polaribacter sp.]
MKYFSQYWDENRDDEYADWGFSNWYFETNDADEVLKQITVYKNGKVTKYDNNHLEDEFGGLCEGALTIDDCDGEEMTKEEFYLLW